MQTIEGVEIHARPETCCLLNTAVVFEGRSYCPRHLERLGAAPAIFWTLLQHAHEEATA